MKLHFMPITIVTTTIIIVVVAVAIVVVVIIIIIIIIRDNRFTLLLVRFAVLMVVEK